MTTACVYHCHDNRCTFIDCVDYEMQYTHHSNAIKYIRPSINAQIFTSAVDAAAGSFTVINSNVWLHECAIAHISKNEFLFAIHCSISMMNYCNAVNFHLFSFQKK